MKEYQYEFIEYSLRKQAIKFGKFTLKSGRISPYFFNIGLFNTGRDLNFLGRIYAEALMDANVPFNLLFGPAYKGIPISIVTAVALSEKYNINVPYCSSRKETKQYGEKGILIGGILYGKAMIVDDVVTTGSTIHESMLMIYSSKAQPVGVMVALDRKEKGKNGISPNQEIRQKYQCQVFSIITLTELISFLKEKKLMTDHLLMIQKYYQKYGSEENTNI